MKNLILSAAVWNSNRTTKQIRLFTDINRFSLIIVKKLISRFILE